jgi:hypothetical protein
MEPMLRIDDEHRYWLGTEELWGVSAVLKDNLLIDDRWFDETSRSRGTAIHSELASIARGAKPFPFIDPDLYAWRQSGIDFLDMLKSDGAEILHVEMMRHHPIYKFAGTMDLVVRWRGYEHILDYKTGKASKATRYQLGAYSLLLGPTTDGKPRRRAAVELQQDGSRAILREYNAPENFHDGNIFLALLTAARTRQSCA